MLFAGVLYVFGSALPFTPCSGSNCHFRPPTISLLEPARTNAYPRHSTKSRPVHSNDPRNFVLFKDENGRGKKDYCLMSY